MTKKRFFKAEELWQKGCYSLRWGKYTIFLGAEKQRYRDVYTYSPKAEKFFLTAGIDTNEGVERGLELLLGVEETGSVGG